MALTHKHRSALYEGLSGIVDEEAVNEMLAYFPTRDGDEPISRDFLRAEMSDLRAEMSDLGAELRAEMSDLGAELRAEMSDLGAELRAEMSDLRADLRTEMGELESRLVDRIDNKFNQVIAANLATLVAFAAVMIAAIKL
ncbi:MAG TPA: hypothetical protein PLV93_00230 [Microthrixaceae bacterium]|nr:hypothetical protein [Microthrixaceae bacterium]